MIGLRTLRGICYSSACMAMYSEDDIFNNLCNQTLEALEYRKTLAGFKLEEVENELESLYTYQGQDWAGRGALKNLEIDAHVSAYQVFIHRIKSALTD